MRNNQVIQSSRRGAAAFLRLGFAAALLALSACEFVVEETDDSRTSTSATTASGVGGSDTTASSSGMGGSDATTSTSGVGGSSTTTAASGTGGGGQQACCDTAMTPGCSDKTVEQCVCKQDAYCCTVEWDSTCVQAVESFGCGKCGDGGAPAGRLVAGFNHTCALTDAGKVRCWGSGYDGALGYGNKDAIGDNELPSAAGDVDVGAKVVQLAANGERSYFEGYDSHHTCALTDAGKVRCWGTGYDGELGYGNKNRIGDDENVVIGEIRFGRRNARQGNRSARADIRHRSDREVNRM